MSLTEPEASFLHQKATYLPAYNAQLAVTEDQIIVHADVTTEPTDVHQAKAATDSIQERFGKLPKKLVADVGYSGREPEEA
jgi:hypothetical protein